MEIPVWMLAAVVPVLLVGMIGFLTWIVRQNTRQATAMASTATALSALGDRVKRLEGWQDGVQFGRAVERAQPTT